MLYSIRNICYVLRVFYDRSLLGRCFRGFILPTLVNCSAVWCPTADTYHKLLDRVVRGASFLTGVVFDCDIAHRRSVEVICMLYNIRCNPMHPLYGALSVPYVPVRVTSGTLVAHRYAYAPPHCAHRRTAGRLFPSQCICGAILLTLYSMMWDWRVSRAVPLHFHWHKLLYSSLTSTIFLYLLFLSKG